MSSFDSLHPAVQHHIVNSLGWRSLRPLQEEAITPILAGENAILLAPTAGGKTEAAVFPVFSRMLNENWRGLSVLYVCPIKALLNNLEPRLSQYAELLGRRVAVWHGDVPTSVRSRILADPPDLLLTTPESIEVMLTSTRTNHRAQFAALQCVIVDEMHAFAGDDRGWHLLAVLERVSHLTGRDIQRLGLSATIGNPTDLLNWHCGSSRGPRRVLASESAPRDAKQTDVDVTLDYVGNLQNAATVISRLHRGEKRLVFCDSRSRVERLAYFLREAEVNTFVSHSSLSVDERKQAEKAFTEGRDAVIVATSTLELGIDVGDLDRVIQIDSPSTVASFLQRIGRTGRRAGTKRNCLFLATNEEALLRAGALLQLWCEGFVEPVIPPPSPYHIFAQQIMALALQEGGIGRKSWRDWLAGMPAFEEMGRDNVDHILAHMLERHILFEEQGILSMGVEGESRFGRRHFMELMTVFTSDPLFTVMHGRNDLGHVHPLSFSRRGDQEAVLLLAGRSWSVKHIDWRNKMAYVEPSSETGRSQWLGSAQALSFELCRAVRRVLASNELGFQLTSRATDALQTIREKMQWVDDESTAIVRDEFGELRWWTFAGLKANAALGELLGSYRREGVRPENFAVRLRNDLDSAEIRSQIREVSTQYVDSVARVSEEALEGLKFSACLPRKLAKQLLNERLADPLSVRDCFTDPVRFISE